MLKCPNARVLKETPFFLVLCSIHILILFTIQIRVICIAHFGFHNLKII